MNCMRLLWLWLGPCLVSCLNFVCLAGAARAQDVSALGFGSFLLDSGCDEGRVVVYARNLEDPLDFGRVLCVSFPDRTLVWELVGTPERSFSGNFISVGDSGFLALVGSGVDGVLGAVSIDCTGSETSSFLIPGLRVRGSTGKLWCVGPEDSLADPTVCLTPNAGLVTWPWQLSPVALDTSYDGSVLWRNAFWHSASLHVPAISGAGSAEVLCASACGGDEVAIALKGFGRVASQGPLAYQAGVDGEDGQPLVAACWRGLPAEGARRDFLTLSSLVDGSLVATVALPEAHWPGAVAFGENSIAVGFPEEGVGGHVRVYGLPDLGLVASVPGDIWGDSFGEELLWVSDGESSSYLISAPLASTGYGGDGAPTASTIWRLMEGPQGWSKSEWWSVPTGK